MTNTKNFWSVAKRKRVLLRNIDMFIFYLAGMTPLKLSKKYNLSPNHINSLTRWTAEDIAIFSVKENYYPDEFVNWSKSKIKKNSNLWVLAAKKYYKYLDTFVGEV